MGVGSRDLAAGLDFANDTSKWTWNTSSGVHGFFFEKQTAGGEYEVDFWSRLLTKISTS
jgi:hypothetical protein